MNHKLYQLIKDYHCDNEQEIKDQRSMLKIMESVSDITTRDNTFAHVTASAWILNHKRTKALMVYHRIYDSWSWCGGHLDGSDDPSATALQEAKAETGLNELRFIVTRPFALDLLPVYGHRKNHQYISSHLHLNLTYLLEADECASLQHKADENSAVAWFLLSDIVQAVSEKHMLSVYEKLIDKSLK